MKLKTLALGFAVGALLMTGLTLGVTEATALGPDVTYYACLNTKAGALSSVGTTAPTCSGTNVTPISWDSQGPQGNPGTDGTNGLSHGYGVNLSQVGFNDNAEHVVATLSIPAGDYVVTAQVNLHNDGPNANEYLCRLGDNDKNFPDPASIYVVPYQDGNISMTETWTEPVATTLEVYCEIESTPTTSSSAFASISAVAVNSLN